MTDGAVGPEHMGVAAPAGVTVRSGAYARVLLVSALGMLITGVAMRAPLMMVFGGAVGCLVLVAWIQARTSFNGLSVARHVYPSAFEGQTVTVELALANAGRRSLHTIELADTFAPSFPDTHVMLEPGPLHAMRLRRLRYRATCSRDWGEYALESVALRGADSLGLFVSRMAAGGQGVFSVLPRVVTVPALDLFGARPTFSLETMRAPRAGASDLWMGVREYRAGDDPRRIHWPATARRGAISVREQELDLVPNLTVLLNMRADKRAGTGQKSTREYLLRTAACVLWSAAERGHISRVAADTRHPLDVPPGAGAGHVAQVLALLARLREDGESTLEALLEAHGEVAPSGATLVTLSAAIPTDPTSLVAAMRALAVRNIRIVALFADAESFIPIARRAPLPVDADTRNRTLLAALRAHGIASAILGAEHDLTRELAGTELLAEPS